jgi:hypothetical protein
VGLEGSRCGVGAPGAFPSFLLYFLGLYHLLPTARFDRIRPRPLPSIMSDQNTFQNSLLQNAGSVGGAAYQTLVEFPYRAFTTPRLAEIPAPARDKEEMGSTPENTERHVPKDDDFFTGPVSEELLGLLTSPESVSAVLAQDPSLSPGEAWKKLYGHHIGKLGEPRPADGSGKRLASEQALHRAAEAGHWGPTRPSDLFLRVSRSGPCCMAMGRDIRRY